jgi:hypothetical protein
MSSSQKGVGGVTKKINIKINLMGKCKTVIVLQWEIGILHFKRKVLIVRLSLLQ